MLHTHFKRGKRIHVILHGGASFNDKYVGLARDQMVFVEHGKVKIADIRSATLARRSGQDGGNKIEAARHQNDALEKEIARGEIEGAK